MDSSRFIDRRSFMRAAGGAAAGSGLLCLVGERESLALPPSVGTRYPLRIPPTVSPNGLTLTVAPTVEDLGWGSSSNAWTYNSEFPGPTILASQGDTATITLVNGLAEETITHWHGMLVDDVNDGHPRFAVPPGGTYGYSFPIQNRAALNWYHPHPHMLTGEQVNLGLAGAFIIRDAEEAALGLPSGIHEVPLIIRDATRDTEGNLEYKPAHGGFVGKIPLVNGTRSPFLFVDRAVYRFRILNGANARIFALALGNGAPFILIGNDGGLLADAVAVSPIDVAPAERLDVIVDFRGAAPGERILLRDLRAGWDLLEFRVTSTAAAGSIPTRLSTIIPLSDPQTTRVFSFDAMSKINGQEYEIDRIDFQVPFGVTERWRFTTNGNAPHPVHVHGASFQVVSRTGGRNALFPWEAGWKDTVLLEDGETVEVLIRFDAYRGLYLLHCHKLEHEDMGMMSNFEVI
jgi:FtsP/CotA-like multicopper oxidase with cupredoxin domain